MAITPEVIGVAGHVARSAMSFALVDGQGQVKAETIRSFGKDEQPTVSGGLSDFLKDIGLSGRSIRASLAVAGVARGDVISITNSPWFVSRSGLSAMLGEPPILLNDFAARAWALSGNAGIVLKALPGAVTPNSSGPGTFCLIGLGMELGVAAWVRSATTLVTVISSEAGASALPCSVLPQSTLTRLGATSGHVEAYTVLSGSGLVRLAQDRRETSGAPVTPNLAALRAIANAHDRPALQAVRDYCDLFWNFAANLVLAYGAWDGLILTGEISELLIRQLVDGRRDRVARKGAHARLLREMPVGLVTFAHGELAGASMALHAEWASR